MIAEREPPDQPGRFDPAEARREDIRSAPARFLDSRNRPNNPASVATMQPRFFWSIRNVLVASKRSVVETFGS